MADEIDHANEYAERMRDHALRQARGKPMPKGEPGECEWCGYYSKRIVRGHCAKCRDELGID
jgi:hypothetical protein